MVLLISMKCGTIKETVRKEKTPCVIVMISCISKAGILTTTVSVVSYQYCISLHFCLQANKPKSHCLCLLLNVKSAEFSTGETFPCRNKYHKVWKTCRLLFSDGESESDCELPYPSLLLPSKSSHSGILEKENLYFFSGNLMFPLVAY